MERCVRNKEMCMYLVCDFNGRWLKYLNLMCCIFILFKSVEGRVIDIVQVGCCVF
jgi:hypothetical protein